MHFFVFQNCMRAYLFWGSQFALFVFLQNSLLSYNSQVDVGNVRFSFLGANSALQLHLAEKSLFSNIMVFYFISFSVFLIFLTLFFLVFFAVIFPCLVFFSLVCVCCWFEEQAICVYGFNLQWIISVPKKVRDRLVCDHSAIYLITVSDI